MQSIDHNEFCNNNAQIILCYNSLVTILHIPSYTRLAIALAREAFAGRIETAHRVTVAALATIARYNVEVSVLTFVTVATDYVWLTPTVSRELLTN